MSPEFRTAVDLHHLLRERSLTAYELVSSSFQIIDTLEPSIHSFLSLSKEQALETAVNVDKRLDAGDNLPFLAGIPIALKDNICVKDGVTTCASKMLESYVSPYDATVVSRLNDTQMPMLGKTNLDEFAMGSSTENSAFSRSCNPWDVSRVPGGSSGGSASAVASGEAVLALGSDTGGSIRQPAAFCGVTGMKPTYGRVSRYGLVAFASSLDQIGPFTRSAEDAAHVMNMICGHDMRDSTSSTVDVPDFTAGLNHDLKGLRIGVPKEMLGDVVEDGVKASVMDALETLKAGGASWDSIRFEMLDYAVSTYYIIAPAEASANLSRYDGVRYTHRSENASTLTEMITKSRGEGFGEEVQRRILLGTYVLSSGYYDAYYLNAQKVRHKISQAFDELFTSYDVIITPTTPTTAFKSGEHTSDPLSMYMADIATIPANMAGLPAISIPAGSVDGLPVGLQIVGKAFDDATVLNVAHVFQTLTNFHRQHPTISEVSS